MPVVSGQIVEAHGIGLQERATSSSVKSSFYQPELDVLRFVAFFLVFLHHTPNQPETARLAAVFNLGRSGLNLFFLLSAYLITELLIRERESTGRVHIPSFFLRRILRIWPLYFLAIGIALLIGFIAPTLKLYRQALPYLFLLSTNFYVSSHGWHLGLIDPLWSISVEEQFYLCIPFVSVLGIRALRNICLLCIAVAYITLARMGYKGADPIDVIWVNSFVQFQFFAAGTLIAIFLHKRIWSPSWTLRAVLLVGGFALLFFGEIFFPLQRTHPASALHLWKAYLSLLAGSVATFLAFLRAPFTPPRLLVYLGKISFGLYVFHKFAIGLTYYYLDQIFLPHPTLRYFVLEPLILLITFGIAAFSYRFFERPILRFKERFAYVRMTST